MGHIPALDGVRGTAALLVLAAHFHGLLGIRNGGIGVDIFFVLSGFLITSLLAKEIDENGTIFFRRFYIRRMLRLAPALLLMVFLFAAIDLVLRLNDPVQVLKSAAVSLAYVQNIVRSYRLWNTIEFGHTWSLAIEEQFYLVWPVLLLAFVRFGKSYGVVLALTVLLILVLFPLRYTADPASRDEWAWVENSFVIRAVAIFVGAAAALLPRANLVSPAALAKGAKMLAPVGMAAVIALTIVNREYMYWQQPFLLIGTAVVLLHLSLTKEGWMASMFSVGWLTYTGKISYGLYLYHYPLWYLTLARVPSEAMPADVKQLISLFVLTPTAYLMAWASYRYVEAPALRLKELYRPGAVGLSPIKSLAL